MQGRSEHAQSIRTSVRNVKPNLQTNFNPAPQGPRPDPLPSPSPSSRNSTGNPIRFIHSRRQLQPRPHPSHPDPLPSPSPSPSQQLRTDDQVHTWEAATSTPRSE